MQNWYAASIGRGVPFRKKAALKRKLANGGGLELGAGPVTLRIDMWSVLLVGALIGMPFGLRHATIALEEYRRREKKKEKKKRQRNSRNDSDDAGVPAVHSPHPS